ncbi:hypothetical protein ACA910_018748 [Epithemia clementina (nom. ined.)]
MNGDQKEEPRTEPLAQAIALADPYRGQGTLYIHTKPPTEEGRGEKRKLDDIETTLSTTTTTSPENLADATHSNHSKAIATTTATITTGEVVVPISLSTTFRQDVPGQATAVHDFHSWGVGYEYARTGNPTRGALERALAQAEGGAKYAVAFSSGSAAVSAILQAIVLQQQQQQQQQQQPQSSSEPSSNGSSTAAAATTTATPHHLLCIDDVYGGTQRYLRRIFGPTHNVDTEFIDMSHPDDSKSSSIGENEEEEGMRLPFRDTTRLVWLESPTNPTLKITDIARIARQIQIENQKRNQTSRPIRLVVDNTFCSPYFQNPLTLGADVVVHSATKYIGGHSDVVLGVACTNDLELYQTLRFLQNGVGAVPSPFDCFLAHRGLKTLHLRMEASARNAMAIAMFLEQGGHSAVQKVIYPGLASHPQHELAKRQQHGFGAMVSFSCIGGREEASIFLTNLHMFALAESLGAVESLAESPSLMTHASVPDAQRALLGIDDSLIRLSVGVESCQDLLDDLRQALDAVLRHYKKSKDNNAEKVST